MIPHDDRGFPLNTVGRTPTVINKTMTDGATEYAQALPAGTKRFTLQARTAADVKLSFTVGTSATNFITVKSGSSYSEDLIEGSHTLYMQSAGAGVVVEIIAWV